MVQCHCLGYLYWEDYTSSPVRTKRGANSVGPRQVPSDHPELGLLLSLLPFLSTSLDFSLDI